MLSGNVVPAAPGLIGFDITDALTAVTARQFVNRGFKFVVRYVGRDDVPSKHFKDISMGEAQAILDAGLALMIVQHPLAEGWVPNGQMGQAFGRNAARQAGVAGIPAGVNLWLDLEGIKPGTPDTDVIAYCNAWFAEVSAVGFETGVYIGASPILTADQLYWDLKTRHYWKGGSSQKAGVPDDIPHRGYHLVQRIAHPGTAAEFDSNVTRTDPSGNAAMWLHPA